jgi:phage-related protein
MNKTAQKIDAITQKMKSMEAPTIKTDSFKALEAELEKAQSEMQALIAEQNQWEAAGISSGNAWDTLNNKIADAEEKVFGISAKMDEMKNSGDAFTNSVNTDAYQKLQQDLQNANADMAVLNKKSEELALKTKETGNAPDGLLGKLKQMKEVLGGVVGKVSDGVKKGVNGLKKIKNSIGGVLSKLKNLRAGANKTSGGFSNLLKTMRQMVLSMAVFQAMSKGVEFLKSGLQNLAVYSKEYNKNMSALVSSTGMLKNSLAVAFAPIISAVIPYLVKLIDWISAAANAVSRFFAILGGKKTYTQAIKQNKNYAASLNNVGKSADNAKGSLAGFDDLDVLQKNDASGSGGGSSSGGADGSGFEQADVGVVSDWAEQFKSAVDSGDWYGVGSLVAQKLNEALSAIDWGFIQTQAANFAINLANGLNGFVSGLDWNLIGTTIGNGLMTGLLFAYTFLTTFDFETFGTKIAEGIEGAITPMLFVTFGMTLASALMAGINTAYGFITSYDWSGLGSSIAAGISTFFSSVDWGKLGLTVGGLILGLLDTITTAIEETDWQQIGTDVATFLGSIDWGGIFSALGEGVIDALEGIYEFLVGVTQNETAATIIEAVAIALGILAGAVAAYNIVMGIYNVVTGIAAAVTTALSSPILAIILVIGALIAICVLLYQNWDTIKEKAVEIWGKIKEFISNAIEKVKEVISNVINKIKETWSNIWGKIKDTASKVWDGIKSAITGTINGIKTGISNTLNAIKSVWDKIWGGLKTTVTNIFDAIWGAIKGVINSILGGIEGMANGVIGGINTVIGALNNLSFDVPDWVPVLGGKTFGFNITELSKVSLPRLANGGITTGATLAEIGEAGREAVLPLENNTGWMDELAGKLASRMPTYNTPTTLVMEVDGKAFAKCELPYFNAESQRIGVRLVTG